MYTVLRLTSPVGDTPELVRLVEKMNPDTALARLEPRRNGDGYVAVLCDQVSWSEHSDALLDFVEKNRDALRSTRASGAIVTVDIALEPKDRPESPWLELRLSEILIAALSAVGATLVVSLYASDS